MRNGKRSDRGSGSVFFDKGSNRWVAMKSLPPTRDGKRKRLRRTFFTKNEATAFLLEGCTDSFAPTVLSEELTVSELLQGWQESVQRRLAAEQISALTVGLYSLCADHLNSKLGAQRANELSVDDVERFLTAQSARFSGRYVAMQRNVLDQAYRWAQRNRLLVWNPAQLSICPKQLSYSQGTVVNFKTHYL